MTYRGEIFKLFFDNEFLEKVMRKSTLYSVKEKKDGFFFSWEELKVFFGIIIFCGYIFLPRRRMLWEKQHDTRNEAMINATEKRKRRKIDRDVKLEITQDDLSFDHFRAKFLEFYILGKPIRVGKAYFISTVMAGPAKTSIGSRVNSDVHFDHMASSSG